MLLTEKQTAIVELDERWLRQNMLLLASLKEILKRHLGVTLRRQMQGWIQVPFFGLIQLLLVSLANMIFLCLSVELLVSDFSLKQVIEILWSIEFSLLLTKGCHRELCHYGFGRHQALHFGQVFVVEEIEVQLLVLIQEVAASLKRFC